MDAGGDCRKASEIRELPAVFSSMACFALAVNSAFGIAASACQGWKTGSPLACESARNWRQRRSTCRFNWRSRTSSSISVLPSCRESRAARRYSAVCVLKNATISAHRFWRYSSSVLRMRVRCGSQRSSRAVRRTDVSSGGSSPGSRMLEKIEYSE